MKKCLGCLLGLAGSWMLVSPQALTGLKQLRWMHEYAFPGEVLAGMLLLGLAYYLLDIRPKHPDRRS